jgi:cobalt-zinc-cadmium efflux system membrane fusion protein
MGNVALAAPISLTDDQRKNFGIEEQVLTRTDEVPLTVLSAMIMPVASGRVSVAVPFAGSVLQVHVIEGQEVEKGQPLATLFSRSFLSEQSVLRHAQAEYAAAKADASRLRTLSAEGIVAGAKVDEAEARLAQAKAKLDEQKHLIQATKPTEGDGGNYLLTAPIRGRVSQVTATVGAGMDAMTSAFVIDQTDKLWVEAQLPTDLSTRVKPGLSVDVEGRRGRVVAVGSAVDPKSRALLLRAEIAGDIRLLPGTAARMTINVKAESGTFSVPQTAVTKLSGQDVIFIDTDRGAFDAVPVKIVGKGPQTISITGDLTEGRKIAVSGISELKSLAGQD